VFIYLEWLMARPKRIDQTDLLNEIKATAWEQIAESGAASLSLRAIARALHITAPAIYHYYPSRDDLVTALIIDAFTSMGDAQVAALQGVPVGDHPARLMALGLAYREWAVINPQRYQLIFGTPIPGYHALLEMTGPAASRSLVPLIACLDAACADSKLRIPSVPLPEKLLQQMEMLRQGYPARHTFALYAALAVWSRVHGLVSLEIGRQFPPCIEDVHVIYQLQMERLIEETLTL
jgi:AcrR family transcriptional regulator